MKVIIAVKKEKNNYLSTLLNITFLTYGFHFVHSLSLDAPVVVMGDRSGSMEIAVQTSAIIAAMLSSVTKTKLVFFDNENMEAPFFPHNTQQVDKCITPYLHKAKLSGS